MKEKLTIIYFIINLLILMNPFEEEQNPFENEKNNNTVIKSINVELWLETNGRRKNTYISGLNLEKEELKKHLQILKKKHGCNGTLKVITEDEKNIEVIHLQGDNIDNIQNYLKTINITNITIRNFQSK